MGVETPETATKVNPGLITEISFSAFGKLYEAVQSAVDAIRGDCDLVIGLTHLGVDAESAVNGYRSVDLLNAVDGIDFAIGIPLDEAMVDYITEALGGNITAEQYGQPRGSLTITLPEATEEAVEPAA